MQPIRNSQVLAAPIKRSRAPRMSLQAFDISVREELKGKRCLWVPRLAPYEYAGGIRYGSVRSIKFAERAA